MSADAMEGPTPLPWHANSPDETLVLGPDNQVVATTLQDEDDYERNYDRRAADADLIVHAVNHHDKLVIALGALLVICGQPITDRQAAVIEQARAAYRAARREGAKP